MFMSLSVLSKLRTIGIPLVKNVSKNFILADTRNVGKIVLRSRPLSTITQENPDQDKLDSIVTEISKGDPEIENKLRVLMLEIEVMNQDGRKAPSIQFLKMANWRELMHLKSKSARHKYLLFLFKSYQHVENRKLKKVIQQKEALEQLAIRKALNLPLEQTYGLSGNSMFIRIYDKSVNKLYNFKAMQAMLYGSKVVIDCSYDQYMTKRESENAAKQLNHLFAANRTHQDPFDMYYCNIKRESAMMKEFFKYIPTAEDPDYPIRLHTESYLDIFPRENLVYLTPHCKNDLIYSPDDVYIIGAMVDKARNDPISAAKAKEHGIRMAKFPLDRYLNWNSGSGKSLAINHAVNILLDYKLTKNWEYSFKHVPSRKLMQTENYHNNKLDKAVDTYLRQAKSPRDNKHVESTSKIQNRFNSKKKLKKFVPIQRSGLINFDD